MPKFNDIMHVAFYTEQMDEMIDFYTKVLGAQIKTLVRYKVYAGREDRPAMKAIAEADPERIFNVYLELAPNQFIELFPRIEGQMDREDVPWNSRLGYSHFALTCDDIFACRAELEVAGAPMDTAISKGPSETYQFWTHDPDGNKFEIMQFTEKSYQVVGHID